MNGTDDSITSSDEAGRIEGSRLCKQDWQCLNKEQCLNDMVSKHKCKATLNELQKEILLFR